MKVRDGMLLAEGISQGYRRRSVFEGISLRVAPGTTALVGPNGAGKTTLLRTLATVQPHRAGRLTVAGVVVTSERSARQARRSIGYLPQSFGVDPAMTVSQFVEYGAWARGVPTLTRPEDVREALDVVGLSDRAHERMRQLSGGMRQRAGIAWAVVGRPSIVILDEPTVGLDPEQRLQFREILRGLDDTAVLLSTHLTDDVDAVCDRVMVMDRGAIVFDDTTENLKSRDIGGPGNTPIERAYMSLFTPGGIG